MEPLILDTKYGKFKNLARKKYRSFNWEITFSTPGDETEIIEEQEEPVTEDSGKQEVFAQQINVTDSAPEKTEEEIPLDMPGQKEYLPSSTHHLEDELDTGDSFTPSPEHISAIEKILETIKLNKVRLIWGTIIPILLGLLSIELHLFPILPGTFGIIEKESRLEELIDEQRQDKPKLTYVFAIDISLSYIPANNQRYRICIPGWYYSQKEIINDFISDSQNDFGDSESPEGPSIFKIAKLRLCALLYEFRNENADFEIRTLGKVTDAFFHGTFGKNNLQTVKEAMKKVASLNFQSMGENKAYTDFICLFRRILRFHDDLKAANHGEQKFPGIILTIVSDMIHDTIPRANRQRLTTNRLKDKIEDDKTTLNRFIAKLSKRKLRINVVQLKKVGDLQEHEIDVSRLLNASISMNDRLKPFQ